MILLFFIIILVYSITIGGLIYGFNKVPLFEANAVAPKTKFSIVVPFRNEPENLPLLLESFSKLEYPSELFEVLLVDDSSQEKFQFSIFGFQFSVLENIRVSNSPKKDAILTAINYIQNQWIITTDADCVVHKDWLQTLDKYIQKLNPEMIVGAVNYDCKNRFLHHFQQLDMASLQGATIGSFGIKKGFMCNGANFAYTKSLFLSLNGFEGNNKIASGDDVFLLQKAISKFPEKVHYLKSESNIVTTKPVDNWKSLFYQRVRWASKTGAYTSTFGKFLALVVFLGNVGCWFLVVGLWLPSFDFKIVFLLLLTKMVFDFILIYKTNSFFKTKTKYLILSSLLYPFFSVSVASYSLFGKYEWKGRRF
jgi:cellulose synthase/poly-beta-1,6-N-acetylglucosamine synthase-like glycosyltransferase